MEERAGATTPGWTSVSVCLDALCPAIAQRSERITSSACTIAKSTHESMPSTRKERDELHWKNEGKNLIPAAITSRGTDWWFYFQCSRRILSTSGSVDFTPLSAD